MAKPENPFILSGYHSPSYFCDRKEETQTMVDAALNGRNVTLYALRRMGKTGLVYNVAHQLRRKHKWLFLYTDVFSTEDEKDLISSLTSSVFQQLGNKKNIVAQVQETFRGLSPLISFDPITGMPKVKLDISSEREVLQSLEEIFAFVDSLPKPVYWAWDEFQQISTYANSQNVMRKIRSLVTQSHNIQFVFSGSHRSMLLSIFEDTKSAFYKSTQMLHLEEIKPEVYSAFITKKFAVNNKECSSDSAARLLDLCCCHTWYVQYLSNRLYQHHDKVEVTDVDAQLLEILREQEVSYYRYRSILSAGQWNLLRAIGIEERVYHVTAQDFIRAYDLGSSATVLRAIDALLRDELVVELWDEDKRYYRLQDVYLMRWFGWKYK